MTYNNITNNKNLDPQEPHRPDAQVSRATTGDKFLCRQIPPKDLGDKYCSDFREVPKGSVQLVGSNQSGPSQHWFTTVRPSDYSGDGRVHYLKTVSESAREIVIIIVAIGCSDVMNCNTDQIHEL